MKVLKILISFLVAYNCKVFAQQEFSKWFLNSNTGLNFATSPPTVINGFALNALEGVSSISDAQGNLLFYSNGITINNAAHNTMANGSGLIGNTSTTQSGLIVKQPGNNSNYYVFTLDEGTATNLGAYYSIVDMSLAAGMGSVVTKNNFLYGPNIEKQIAIRHCNGKDVWIVSHEGDNNNFRAYLLTESGLISSPVISSTGDLFYTIGFWSAGEMKSSPDGKKIGWATYSPSANSFTPPCGFHLYDFDASSGTVSNPLFLLSTSQAYGVEFSPDGTKLYGTRRDITPASTSTLCQWDICNTNTASIISSLYTTTVNARLSSIQRAIDNKLYLVNVGSYSMCVINNPNNSAGAMNLAVNSLTVGSNVCAQGLPNYVTGITKPLNSQISYTSNCQNFNFTAPSYTTSVGCSSVSFPINGYLWDFGDNTSGSANTSTLSNPSHFFSGLGNYTVTLILFSNCSNDTLSAVVNVSLLSPTISVSGSSTICKGEKALYSVSGGTSYVWNGSTNSSTISLSPTVTTQFNVVGTSSLGCKTQKNFTITVNPCLNFTETLLNEEVIKVWPSPFNSIINVLTPEPGHIQILNIQGEIVYNAWLEKGSTEINTSQLVNGIYIVSLTTGKGTNNVRVTKLN